MFLAIDEEENKSRASDAAAAGGAGAAGADDNKSNEPAFLPHSEKIAHLHSNQFGAFSAIDNGLSHTRSDVM